MTITHINTARRRDMFSDISTRPDERKVTPIIVLNTKRTISGGIETNTPPPDPVVEQKVVEAPQPNARSTGDEVLLGYYDIDHVKSRLYLHVWPDSKVIAFTETNETFRETEDYFTMVLRFPFAAKDSYFATASSFIDNGFSDMELVETLDRLVDLDLD